MRSFAFLILASPLVSLGCSSQNTDTPSASNGGGGVAANAGGGGAGGAATGGVVGSAGNTASGGVPASGGTPSGGATTGGVATGGAGAASGGSAGASGSATTGGSASGGSGGSALGGDCASLPLCDTFEDTAVGMPPKSALWTLVPASASGSATIDASGAHGSMHSLKVVSPDRLYLRNTTVIGTLGPVAHARFYLKLASALADGHGAMIVTHPTMVDQYSQSNELRFGSQGNVFHWNTDSDAANIPDVSPNGNAASVKPVADKWYCVELTINTNGNLSASIDGTDVPGLTADGMGTANIDQSWVGSADSLSRYKMLADFSFGWQSYGGGALTLWYDDVALSSSPIGCQ